MRKPLLLLFPVMLALSGCNFRISTEAPEPLPPAKAGTAAQTMAVFTAGKDIVHRIDDGKYDQVWEESSDIMKRTAPKFAMKTTLSSLRKPLGKPSPRGRPAIGFTDNIDWNLPKGEYAVMEFDSTFGRKVVHEKLVLAREQGTWKLAGYLITFPDGT